MTDKSLNLGSLFSAVASNLLANQTELNNADTQNNNHGDNITQAFQIISQAVQANNQTSLSNQLSNASQALQQQTNTGSGQIYAQNLAQAANQLQGEQSLTTDNLMTLVSSLLGNGSSATSQAVDTQSGDVLGSLLQDCISNGDTSGQNQLSESSGDALGGLLNGIMGGTSANGESNADGLDMGDLINAGLGYMQAKGRGEDDLQAIVNGIINASPLGKSPARARSAQIVASTILQQVRKMASSP